MIEMKPLYRHMIAVLATSVLSLGVSAHAKNTTAPEKSVVFVEANKTNEVQTIVEPPKARHAMVRQQVPGYYRLMVGSFEVTALFDGVFNFHQKLLKNESQETINKILQHHYGKTNIQTPINAYLIHTGTHLVLIDAGAGQLFSEKGQGKILENLKASGYSPEDVDTVVMTHLHGDHTGGLADKEGNPIFPNAVVYANKIENEYWLSEQVAAQAPVEKQIFFKMARSSAAPYATVEKWKAITPGKAIVPGIVALEAYGHTPGHIALEVASNGQKLVIWGDIVHNHAIQFKKPSVAIEYDSDVNQAVRTREMYFKVLAQRGQLVAGMHLPFPGLGYVRYEGSGQYAWVPIEYSPLPDVTDAEQTDEARNNKKDGVAKAQDEKQKATKDTKKKRRDKKTK